ncbi:hypothetical protein LCGC14_1236690 [marine sediment metagenome]|uniref:Uncharacterized protein n=1 Tax=marine sediment metagenome TaxID=412755 RepID=A0A0F9NP58_9ZZZZ
MIEATEIAGQDTLDLGDVGGGGDVDIDFSSGQMVLQGSSGNLGLGDAAPGFVIDAVRNLNSAERIVLQNTNSGNAAQALFQCTNDNGVSFQAGVTGSGHASDANECFFQSNPAPLNIRTGGANPIRFITNTINRLNIGGSGNIGIGNVTSPTAKLHIDQSNGAAAIPVLTLDQADVSEPFTKYIGTAAAATLTQSIVDDGDVTTATLVGWTKIEIDDVGNQVADGDYFQPFYTLA